MSAIKIKLVDSKSVPAERNRLVQYWSDSGVLQQSSSRINATYYFWYWYYWHWSYWQTSC